MLIATLGAIQQHVLIWSIGIGLLTAGFGLNTGLLRTRPEPRRCPSCGWRLRGRTCRHCRRS